jgi:hypothetical protein
MMKSRTIKHFDPNNDRRIISFRAKHGHGGYGLLWATIEYMVMNKTGFSFSNLDMFTLALGVINVEGYAEIIKSAISCDIFCRDEHTGDYHYTGAMPKKPSRTSGSTTKIAYAPFVSMEKKEFDKLQKEFGQADTRRMIEILNNYKGARGRQYKSDYLAIRNWVIDRLNKEKNRGNYESNKIQSVTEAKRQADLRFIEN